MRDHIETEIKLELNAEEYARCVEALPTLGYPLSKESSLDDHYFHFKKFDDKGWDFTRIRVYNGTDHEKTEKTWYLNEQGERMRREVEGASTADELTELQREGTHLSLHKIRRDFAGTLFTYPCVFSLDDLTFSNGHRYFIECEIEAPKEVSNSIREELRQWMLTHLNLTDRPEAIGMMRLALVQAGLEKE